MIGTFGTLGTLGTIFKLHRHGSICCCLPDLAAATKSWANLIISDLKYQNNFSLTDTKQQQNPNLNGNKYMPNLWAKHNCMFYVKLNCMQCFLHVVSTGFNLFANGIKTFNTCNKQWLFSEMHVAWNPCRVIVQYSLTFAVQLSWDGRKVSKK